jgi:hypothetical protein
MLTVDVLFGGEERVGWPHSHPGSLPEGMGGGAKNGAHQCTPADFAVSKSAAKNVSSLPSPTLEKAQNKLFY